VLTAGLVANPVHGVPKSGRFPDVPLVDAELERDPAAAMEGQLERMQRAAKEAGVRLTAAECYAEIETSHLLNSRGIDAEQMATRIDIEFTLQSKQGDHDAEVFGEMTRRRLEDLHLEREIAESGRHTLDLLEATRPPTWEGAVVVRGQTLATMLGAHPLSPGVIGTLADAGAKYAKISSWEIGKSVFRGEVKGDPLTVWANRLIPFGTYSDRFDAEGLPAQRVELIREGVLTGFAASQRYAEYLGIQPTGAFGAVELPAGRLPAAELLSEPYVEVIQFSWFNPDPITADFASEIRFGYLVEGGVRKPFKGGQLIGNLLDALANVRWSSETGFFGNYLGPRMGRFADLKVSGAES
jgi:PmbA protein